METPLSAQLLLLAATLLVGLGLGLVYDFFRVIRESSPAAVGVVTDLLFCLIFAGAMFLLGMGPARGTLRFYMPPLALVGAGIWFLFFGADARKTFHGLRQGTGRILRLAAVPAGKALGALNFLKKKIKKTFSILEKRFTITGKRTAAKTARRKRTDRGGDAGENSDETETGKYIYKNCDPRADRLRDGDAGEQQEPRRGGGGRPGNAAGKG